MNKSEDEIKGLLNPLNIRTKIGALVGNVGDLIKGNIAASKGLLIK